MSLAVPFDCALVKDENLTGLAISESLIPVEVEQDGKRVMIMKAMIGVLWDEQRSPAPSYHSPDELVWIEVADDEDEDEIQGQEVEG